MDDRDGRLGEHLERLRRALLALETYMAQVRDLIAVTQAPVDERKRTDPSPKRPRRPARPK